MGGYPVTSLSSKRLLINLPCRVSISIRAALRTHLTDRSNGSAQRPGVGREDDSLRRELLRFCSGQAPGERRERENE